jgi:hypothetical protein
MKEMAHLTQKVKDELFLKVWKHEKRKKLLIQFSCSGLKFSNPYNFYHMGSLK